MFKKPIGVLEVIDFFTGLLVVFLDCKPFACLFGVLTYQKRRTETPLPFSSLSLANLHQHPLISYWLLKKACYWRVSKNVFNK